MPEIFVKMRKRVKKKCGAHFPVIHDECIVFYCIVLCCWWLNHSIYRCFYTYSVISHFIPFHLIPISISISRCECRKNIYLNHTDESDRSWSLSLSIVSRISSFKTHRISTYLARKWYTH